jgi:hypothetical protein
MKNRVITECFFDTILVEKIIQNTNIVWHRRGSNNVVKSLLDDKIKDDFKIGVIDKDKRPLKYLEQCKRKDCDGFIFYWSSKSPVVIVQLNPPLESWIFNICKEENFDLETIGLYNDVKVLRNYTKFELVNESEKLKKLVTFLLNCQNSKIENLKKCLNHLLKNQTNFNIDIDII